MKKTTYSFALVGAGLSALTQQATAMSAEIKVDDAHVSDSLVDSVQAVLSQSHTLEINDSTASLAKFLKDSTVDIDVKAIQLALVEAQDQTVKYGATSNYSSAVTCYSNCHVACHGSRSWR